MNREPVVLSNAAVAVVALVCVLAGATAVVTAAATAAALAVAALFARSKVTPVDANGGVVGGP